MDNPNQEPQQQAPEQNGGEAPQQPQSMATGEPAISASSEKKSPWKLIVPIVLVVIVVILIVVLAV